MTPVHWTRLEKLLLSLGLRFDRQKGSHRAYVREGLERPVIVPARPEVPVSIIKNILQTLTLSREDYFRLLQD